MENSLLNKFKKFLDIVLDNELSFEAKIRKVLGKKKKEEETVHLNLNLSETKEEFAKKLSDLTANSINPGQLAALFGLLADTVLSVNYTDITMTLLDKVEEKDIVKSFEAVIKSDNLKVCEVFLSHTEDKYKNILSKDSDYIYYLSLSVASGAKKITEFFLKNNKFSTLLEDKNVAKTALVACLLGNHIEVANIILSHTINLSAFKDENGNPANLENHELYKPEVIKQIHKKLLHDQLITDLEDNLPVKTKRAKI